MYGFGRWFTVVSIVVLLIIMGTGLANAAGETYIVCRAVILSQDPAGGCTTEYPFHIKPLVANGHLKPLEVASLRDYGADGKIAWVKDYVSQPPCVEAWRILQVPFQYDDSVFNLQGVINPVTSKVAGKATVEGECYRCPGKSCVNTMRGKFRPSGVQIKKRKPTEEDPEAFEIVDSVYGGDI